ncbi:hypothetical protein P8452_76382 [Trifolium repens]|nr:hypothetical protein P8452_76382 [Trifolium repens]
MSNRIKSFKTVISPNEENIEICPKFRAAWNDKLTRDPCGYLVHPTGNAVFLELQLQNGNCYMTPGKVVSILFGIREPTEVILTYKIHDNFFNLKFIQQGVIDISSDDESDDEYVIQSHNYILHDFDNDGVFGWERIMTEAAANDKKNQVLHIPPQTAQYVLRDMKNIKIKTLHNLNGSNLTITTYTRPNGRKDMYFTEGWYAFKKANRIEKGDKLEFKVSDPPEVVLINIVRHNN